VASEDERRSYYGVFGRQTDRLHRLVEALLDFGRMEADAAPYRPERASIDRLVRSVVAEFTAEASAQGEAVAVHVTSAAVDAAIDREAMANAIRNLLDNAIKYSPETREAWVDVRTSDGGAVVSVRDRGMGIPDAEQPEIFKKFHRGTRAKSERIAGTGIGLAIVHHVVTAHGGTVSVESKPDQGSTFTIWLPRGSPAERAAEAESECHAS
jgi:signal transduction histidine kinase